MNSWKVKRLSKKLRNTKEQLDMRVEAAKELEKLGAVEPLVAVLIDERSRVKESTKEFWNKVGSTAGTLNDWAGERLGLTYVQNQSLIIQKASVQALGQIGDVRATKVLQAILKDDDLTETEGSSLEVLDKLLEERRNNAINLRETAAEALGKIGDPESVKLLVDMLVDDGVGMKTAALQALEVKGWQPEDDEERALQAIAQERWDDVATFDPVVLIPLLEKYPNKPVMLMLKKIGPAATPILVTGVQHKFPAVRRESVKLLEGIKDIEATEALVVALQDENSDVRRNASWALAKRPEAVGSLARLLEHEASYVHDAVNTKGDRALESLISNPKVSDVAKRAVEAISRILNDAAKNVTQEDLRTVAILESTIDISYRYRDAEGILRVDCSKIIEMSQQEMVQRGLEV